MLSSNGGPEVLIVIEGEIATTELIEQIVGACAAHGIGYRKCLLSALRPSDISASTLPLFVRCGDPLARQWAEMLRRAGIVYAYYIDDNFWRIVGDSPLALYYRHPIVRGSLECCIANAGAVITNSVELASFLESFDARTEVLPSFFDFSLVDAFDGAVDDASAREVRIGFAGSASRAADLELLAPVIPEVLARHSDVVFEFIGAFPRGVTEGPRVRFFPHVGGYKSYVRFQMQRGWRIGLAPLMDHEANRAKTDNKYREYAAYRCAGIYSNIPPYRDAVEGGKTGLMADNTPEQWRDAICRLVERPDEVQAIATAAFASARARYDLANVSAQWADCFVRLAASRQAGGAPIDGALLERAQRKANRERQRLHFDITYGEGGWAMIASRSLRKIGRMLGAGSVR